MNTGRMLNKVVLFPMMLLPAALHALPCDRLSQFASPTLSITLAKVMDAGNFTPAGSTNALQNLPAFCRVAVDLKPTPDSDIHMEVWLPTSQWNGKFIAVGSGGWGGSLSYGEMADALRRGYAISATDDGHTGRGASFVVGHPEKLIDFAYRAEHEMTVEAKTLIHAFYGRDPRYSYWKGCSGGGREGLLQASRYPDEFDGIIAGDPANIRRNAWALELANQTFKDPEAYIPPAKYPMIHRAVLEACDAKDGLKDGLIEAPESCNVDFKSLQCKASDGPDCLTAHQVQTAQTITSPVATKAGKILFPRVEPGTELRWGRLAGGPQPADYFWTSSVTLCIGIPIGTGEASTLNATPPRRMQSIKTLTSSIQTLRPSRNMAESCSSITAGQTNRSLQAPALSFIKRCWNQAVVQNKPRTCSVSSWLPAWHIVQAERALIPSTRSA